MWGALASFLAGVVTGLVGAVLPVDSSDVATQFLHLPAVVVTDFTGFVAVFGLFIDFHVFFGCAALIVSWRLLWLIVKVWQNILASLPTIAGFGG